MKGKPRKLRLKCEALGCGFDLLKIVDMEDGDFEIEGVFLKKKSVEKLVKFLTL